MSSSRAPRPGPLDMTSSGGSGKRHSSFGSLFSDNKFQSNDWVTDYKRKSSEVKPSPSRKSSGSSSKSLKSPSSPTANVHTHCGRHSDQWLLGGRSMSDLWRSSKKE